jgi:hypothetical protein
LAATAASNGTRAARSARIVPAALVAQCAVAAIDIDGAAKCQIVTCKDTERSTSSPTSAASITPSRLPRSSIQIECGADVG